MDTGSVLLILGLLVLVGLFISRPLLERRSQAVSQEEHELSALMAERDRLLDALQELDFDHALGKVPVEEYPLQRTLLLQRGAEILRQLDAHQAHPANREVDARLEAAIASRRLDAGDLGSTPAGADRPPAATAPQDDELEAVIAARRRERSEKAAGFCPNCGQAVQQSDQFCAHCGARQS